MRDTISATQSSIKTICIGIVLMLLLIGCQPIQSESVLPQAARGVDTPTGTASITATAGIGGAGIGGVDVSATEALTQTSLVTNTVVIHGGDEETLREFLRQYLISPFTTGDESTTEVYIGTLPPELPFTLELPAGMEVVGSVVTMGEFANSQLMFTADQNVAEIVTTLRQQLESQGYERMNMGGGGQIFQTESGDYLPQCSPDDTHSVIVNGRSLPDGGGVVRFYINNESPLGGNCAQIPPDRISEDEYAAIMPNLPAPANVASFSSGMSSGGDHVEATIGLRGETTIAALAEHYNGSLEDAGWHQTGASQTEDMAWSGWTITDNEQSYVGTFYVVRDAGSSDRFYASLRIERTQ